MSGKDKEFTDLWDDERVDLSEVYVELSVSGAELEELQKALRIAYALWTQRMLLECNIADPGVYAFDSDLEAKTAEIEVGQLCECLESVENGIEDMWRKIKDEQHVEEDTVGVVNDKDKLTDEL